MIGVIPNESEKKIVREFFELFKVPWEFYNKNRNYSVVLSTQDTFEGLDAKLLILYNSKETGFDTENKIEVIPQTNQGTLIFRKTQIPVYGKIANLNLFDKSTHTKIKIKGNAGEAVGIEINENSRKIIRVGFDLFQEVYFLLTSGQPVKFSEIPTLDIHISILREWILESGIPLVEIPPVPAGYNFAVCLTHDIDFAGIRKHKFDHTMGGFLYRALFGSMRDALKRKIPWDKLYKNWKAVFSLPAVYAGFAEDFWMPFNRYRKVEEGLRSTFFIIPFKNYAGSDHTNTKGSWRATRYDISDIEEEIEELRNHGCEVGVHGIDAWRDTEKGLKEYKQIHDATGTSEIGIRMHWLYFNEQSPEILEDAGFFYDSTLGYNDAVGYRSGTTQVFRPIGVKRLLELPLHIQDTALFFPDRMALTEEDAWILIKTLLENAEQYGGALTINWHDRSLAPERLWGDFYIKLLENLKKSKAWIDTASLIVRWFDKRRSVQFEEVIFLQDKVTLRLSGKHDDDVPDLMARIYTPKTSEAAYNYSGMVEGKYIDIPFTNILRTEIQTST